MTIILAPMASFSLVRAASSVTLEWEPSPDNDVAGYFLFNGIVGTSYLSLMDVGNQTQATVTNLVGGVTNFFFITAYNATGSEGPPSEVILTNLPGTYPAPTISAIPSQTISQNTATDPIPLTVSDALFNEASLRLSGTSSNPTLIPNSNILFSGAGANRTLIVLPALGQVGRAIITITVSDEIGSVSTSFLLRVGEAVQSTLVYLPFEAESGSLISPMKASADPDASGGKYVSIPDYWSGSASFAVDIPVAGAYLIWRRTRAPDRSVWSFTVYVDEMASRLFDEVMATETKTWQWAIVNGSFGSEVPGSDGSESGQSVFPFTVGRHTISFHGLDPDVGLDAILITNDRNFVPPALSVPPRQRIKELTPWMVTNTVAVSDPSAASPSFSLTAAPSGVILDPLTGVLTWTPTEEQGPSTNVIGVQVTDNRLLPLTERSSFTVVVEEVNNHAPVLTVPGDRVIDEMTPLVVTNTFTDGDQPPPERPTFSLVAAPEGMFIDPGTGVIVWTPTEAQGPSTNLITVQVSDNGSPPLSDSRSFTVIVNEVNRAPTLTVPRNRTIHQLATLVVTNSATDPDLPTNTLTYSLVSAPEGVTLDPLSGVLSWTPTEAQRPSTNLITLRVTDSGSPALSDSASFTVKVNEVNGSPEISPVPRQTIRPGALLVVTNTAFDPDVPPDVLTFSLGVGAPAGASIDPTSGVFSWKPTATQADSTNAVTVWITDDGSPAKIDSTTFQIVVSKLMPLTLTSISVENDNVHVQATGDPGILYSLQGSIDLASWTSLSSLEPRDTTFELVDSNGVARPYRFYRVVGQ